jgi:GGDEF domain-containing protein
MAAEDGRSGSRPGCRTAREGSVRDRAARRRHPSQWDPATPGVEGADRVPVTSPGASDVPAGPPAGHLRAVHGTGGTDALTSALTRPAGLGLLAAELSWCQDGGGQLVIGFVDVDDSTSVGDEVYRQLGVALRAPLRREDFFLRLAAGRFICVFPGLSSVTVRARLRVCASAFTMATGGATVSMGVTAVGAGQTLDDLLRLAERGPWRDLPGSGWPRLVDAGEGRTDG